MYKPGSSILFQTFSRLVKKEKELIPTRVQNIGEFA